MHRTKKKKIYEDPFLEQQLISHYFLRELTDQTTNLPTGGSNRRGCGAEIKTGSGGGRARAPTLVFFIFILLLFHSAGGDVASTCFIFVCLLFCLFVPSFHCLFHIFWMMLLQKYT